MNGTRTSASSVHLHIGRIVVDAGAADAISSTQALTEAIQLRLSDAAEYLSDDSLSARIADALRPRLGQAVQGDVGDQHDIL